MKKKNIIIGICVLSAVLSYSGLNSVSADNFTTGLKNSLLLNNTEENIYQYNTNDDNTVNVLDLCRQKSRLVSDKPVIKDPVVIKFGNPDIDYTSMTVYIPVEINNSSYNISTFQMNFTYDRNCFSLTDVKECSNMICSFSRENDVVQFSRKDGTAIADSGVLCVFELHMSSEISTGTYQYGMSGVQIAEVNDQNETRSLYDEEYRIDTPYTYVSVNAPVITVPETTVPETTAPVTTPPVTTAAEPEFDVPEESIWFINELNKIRIENNLEPFEIIPKNCRASLARAEQMSIQYDPRNSRYLPDGRDYKELLYEYKVFPIATFQYLDNSSANVETLFDRFCRNEYAMERLLLKHEYDEAGVGHYKTSSGQNYWAVYLLD